MRHTQAAHAAIDFDAIAADVAATEAACALTASPLVLGHNDLLSGNILVLQEPGFNPESPDMDRQIVFIDFEYGAYTSRGFDIGNHFCEYAGFECDYSRCGYVYICTGVYARNMPCRCASRL